MHFAEMLVNELLEITDIKITLTRVVLNPAKPLSEEIVLEMPIEDVKNRVC